MSKTGVGRGRGWLNLGKTQNAPNINRVGNAPISPQSVSKDDNDYVDAKCDFQDLSNKVKQLNINDDGILFNQKIKYILENWKEDCQTGEQVEQSFDSLYKQCLNDTELALKLVLLVSSRSFITQEIHDQNIRLLFLKKLQENFEGAKQMQKNNPSSFRNSVRLLGEFYYKARLGNGKQLTFMAPPLLSYLEMLLDSVQPDDLQLFTTQLHLNGASIRTECPEKTTEILNSVRLTLASDRNLSKESKLWLLLALEVANNRFGLLSSDVHRFYQDHLGDTAMASFQVSSNSSSGSMGGDENRTAVTHTSLSVQTSHDNRTLDSYQSSVNVLQVSSSSASSDTGNDTYNTSISNKSSTTDFSNSSSFNNSNNYRQTPDSANNSNSNNALSSVRRAAETAAAKCGRPILGAGARLNKCRVEGAAATGNNANFKDARDNNAGGWNGKQQGGSNNGKWGGDNSNSKKTAKGWEHDDRFDNDYS